MHSLIKEKFKLSVTGVNMENYINNAPTILDIMKYYNLEYNTIVYDNSMPVEGDAKEKILQIKDDSQK